MLSGMIKYRGAVADDYRGQHGAPTSDGGAPIWDVTKGVYPEDIYTPNGLRYYGDGTHCDAESIAIIHSLRGKPNRQVKIYRAVPKYSDRETKIKEYEQYLAYMLRHGKLPPGVSSVLFKNYSEFYDHVFDKVRELKSLPLEPLPKMKINPGDWVTICRAYAVDHGKSALHGNYRILSKTVYARDVWTNGDSLHEWGYDPQPRVEVNGATYTSEKNTAGLVRYRGAVYRLAADKKVTMKAPTPEMIEQFEQRTNQHIDLVHKYMDQLAGYGDLDPDELAERGEEHDADKWDAQTAYCWVTEYYRFKNDGKDIPADVQEQYDLSREATGRHVKQNRHHPEAHADIADMTDLDIAEMVADWSAMAEELDQGSARGWADKNVGKKWDFSNEQVNVIYEMIEWLEEQ